MKRKKKSSWMDKGATFLVSIIMIFGILGIVVFTVSRKINREMSASAVTNLSESLDMVKGTVETILKNQADFQKLIAQEIGMMKNPEKFVCNYQKNHAMVRFSLIRLGETEGVSNTGEKFSEEGLDFSAGADVNGLSVSKSYLNYMGTWAYTMKCPVFKNGKEIATLYIEYIFDSIEESLPDGFYNGKAMLYIMDAESERLVLKPRGKGQRDAGHLNLEDYYRANRIVEQDLRSEVSECVKAGENIMFHHNIRGRKSLNYMWAINGGALYLIGYVPVGAIQQEGRTVSQNIFIVVAVMLITFLLCCTLYYFSQRQQNKVRKERDKEREVYSQQLAEALQAARIASHSKTMFLSNMSHDIRTPMNAVIGFTTLLDRDADNPVKVKEYTKKIMASGRHLLSLINDVLDISKIESGKVVLTIEEFTLKDLVSSIDAIIRPMAKEKKQEFHVEITGIMHEYFLGDATRINQVLINLLSNAVKYTPEYGNIWFRMIGGRQRGVQSEHITIEVEDDGYGMTQEYLETIFEAFTRAENSTTNKVQGTGLGMAIAKNIVELMGGTINVSSEIDKGSLFRVEIEFRIPQEHTGKQLLDQCGLRKVLVVCHDPDICDNICSLLEASGIHADSVADINDSTDTGQYQVILADWSQKGSEGIMSAKIIRQTVPETVPVMYLASFDVDGTEEVLRLKRTGILTRPFFVSGFAEKLLEMQKQAADHGDEQTSYGQDNLQGLYFLAAEDNEINAEILTEILSVEGAGCEVVENGRLAVERFQNSAEGRFDAILMDVQMPVMNGYDATRAIRAMERKDAGEIPIIAMTANAFAEDEKEALESGMNVHLPKPVDVEVLKKVIRKCLREKEKE